MCRSDPLPQGPDSYDLDDDELFDYDTAVDIEELYEDEVEVDEYSPDGTSEDDYNEYEYFSDIFGTTEV